MLRSSAILFDMDGVLANVGSSYREAIIKTAEHFGVNVNQNDISEEKQKGNANNDWILSKKLIDSRIKGTVSPSLEEVTSKFEEIYQGTATKKGLCENESLIPSKGLLVELHKRCNGKVAIVTGRPRKDCDKFLRTYGLTELFPIAICMEDAPAKPDPKPIILACEQLGIDPKFCVMVGDTPDDIRSAVSAGSIPIGVLTPEEDAKIVLGLTDISQGISKSMTDCGAIKVIKAGLYELLDLTIQPYFNFQSQRVGDVFRQTKETSISASVVEI